MPGTENFVRFNLLQDPLPCLLGESALAELPAQTLLDRPHALVAAVVNRMLLLPTNLFLEGGEERLSAVRSVRQYEGDEPDQE